MTKLKFLIYSSIVGLVIMIITLYVIGVFSFKTQTETNLSLTIQNDKLEGMTYNGKNEFGCAEYTHNQTGMVFVQIPAGQFKMGSNDGEIDEKPVHEVVLDSFLISKYEVTQDVWHKIMGNNPSYLKGNQNPVEEVNWNNCQEFCKKAGVRLPTEAEWEYACRAGGNTKFYWGDKEEDDYMWHSNNSGKFTHPVGQKKPNGYGLYDMSGNVWEWCQDWYGANYYAKSPKSNPKGPNSGYSRVVRGGSWFFSANGMRVANRYNYGADFTFNNYGFRCVHDIDKKR